MLMSEWVLRNYTYWWHAIDFIDGSTCRIVYFISNVNFSSKIRESWLVNVHWRWDDQSHDPCGDYHDDSSSSTSLGHVLQRIEDSIESVNTDTNQTVNAGRTKGHICCGEDLACCHSPYPSTILYRVKIRCLLSLKCV